MHKLSKLDHQILECLGEAPRATNKSIAQTLKVSEATAAVRIKRMEQNGTMRIVPMHDFAFVGHDALAILDIHVSGRPIDSVAAELASIDQTISVVIMSGTPALITSVTERDAHSLTRLIIDRIGRIEGVRSIQTNYVPEIAKWKVGYGLLSLAEDAPIAAGDGAYCSPNVDDLDRDIVNQFQLNGRMSNRQIAKIVNTSEHTVRQRVRKLEEAGILRFTLVVDAPTVNIEAAAYVRLATHPRRTREVAQAISEIDSCVFVGHILGRHDIVALLNRSSRQEMMSLISERIGALPGVDYYEVREPIGYVKNLHSRAKLLPDTPGQVFPIT